MCQEAFFNGLIGALLGSEQINDADDLAVTAGWGNPGRGGITMPAGGKAREREHTEDEAAALRGMGVPPMRATGVPPVGRSDTSDHQGQDAPGTHGQDAHATLGTSTFDIYLNENVYWRNIPAAVWEYTLGGYQVIKKWLSYREHKILGRPLRADEARYVTEMARRIAAIVLLQPALDENYRGTSAGAYACPKADDKGERFRDRVPEE